MFQPKCKICKSSKAENIEFCRYFLGWSYRVIIDNFCDDIDALSGYNLSVHFNRHTSSEAKQFWRELKAKATTEKQICTTVTSSD